MFRMVCVVLLLALALPSSGLAQTSANAQSSAEPLRATGAFFALSVADLEATATWYAEKLGLKRVMTNGRNGTLRGVVVLEGGGLTVELIAFDGSQRPSSSAPEAMQGITKAGVLVSNFDQAIAALRSRGVEIVIGPYPARPAIRANAIFRDREGNLIQVLGSYAK